MSDNTTWETRERIGNASNRHQGSFKRVLAVCSGGLLRSPTIAHTLAAEPYNYNTRSAGTSTSYALNLVDQVLLEWADEIVCADREHEFTVRRMLEEVELTHKKVITLGIPDMYAYRNPTLVKLIRDAYDAQLGEPGSLL
jgi:predicted protein tyrosine phosphatase